MVRRALPVLAVSAAFLFSGMYLFTALPRMFYPHDLDFLENNSLMQALRFAADQPVYTAPSADFVATIYTPLYTWLGGLLFRFMPPGFFPLRLISFSATLLTATLIGFITHRESRQRWLALACAGLYLGGYRISGFWYDLARVDSLALALSLLGLTLGIYANHSRPRLLFSALTLALAFFTKQTTLAFGLAFLIYGFYRSFFTAHVLRFTFWFILPYTLTLLLSLLTFHVLTHGWSSFYIFTAAAADAEDLARVWHYLGPELLGVISALSLTAFWVAWRSKLKNQPWLWMIVTAALISGIGRASVGGNLNNLMPVYALLCLAPALNPHPVPARAPFAKRANEGGSNASPPQRWFREAAGEGLGVGSAVLLLIQFIIGIYNPLRYIPTPLMREQGNALIAQLQNIDGPVLVMLEPYYAWRAGHAPSAQIASLWHLHHWLHQPWPTDLLTRLETRYYSAVLSAETFFETDSPIHQSLLTNYPFTQTLTAPSTLTGLPIQTQTLYLPQP